MCISVMDIIYRDGVQTGFGSNHKLFRRYYQQCLSHYFSCIPSIFNYYYGKLTYPSVC